MGIIRILHSFERFETVIITPQITKEAIDCSIINKLSFRDALIVTAAEGAKCEKLWSADFNDGQVIRGVRIENPLIEDYPAASCGECARYCGSK